MYEVRGGEAAEGSGAHVRKVWNNIGGGWVLTAFFFLITRFEKLFISI